MSVGRCLVINFVIIAAAVGFTYAVGLATKAIWGISV
jgi:hypothetical protein